MNAYLINKLSTLNIKIKVILVFLIVLIFIFCKISLANENNKGKWKHYNPLPHGENIKSIFAINEEIVFAAGKTGTFIKSNNAGESWEVIETGTLEELTSIYFNDENRGWIVGTNGILLQTNDGGKTWNKQQFKHRFSNIFFIDENTGWIVGYEEVILGLSSVNFLLHTTDGGKTWDYKELEIVGNPFKVIFIDPQTGWIAGKYGLKSTKDGGKTWDNLLADSKMFGFSDLSFVNDKLGWGIENKNAIPQEEGSILKTTDGGKTWQKVWEINIGMNVKVYFTDSLNGWVLDGDNNIIHTLDGGISWEKQYHVSGYKGFSILFANHYTGWIAGHGGKIYYTNDKGNTWQKRYKNLCNVDRCPDMHFVDRYYGWLIGSEGLILHTSDGGISWISQISGTSNNLSYVFFIDKDTGWVTGQSIILRTQDGGNNWETLLKAEDFIPFTKLYFIDGRNGWIVRSLRGNGHLLFRTRDGGETWEPPVEFDADFSLRDIQFITPKIHVAIGSKYTGFGYDGQFIRTNDGWQSRTEPIVYRMGSFNAVHFIDEKNGWIVGDDEHILITKNGGKNWSILGKKTDKYVSYKDVFFANADTGWVIGNEGRKSRILKTHNGGDNWYELDFYSNSNTLQKFYYIDEFTKWILGDFRLILRYVQDEE